MTPLRINLEHEQMALNNNSFSGQLGDFKDFAEPLKFLIQIG